MNTTQRIIKCVSAFGLVAGFAAIGVGPASGAPVSATEANATLVVSSTLSGPPVASLSAGSNRLCLNATYSTISAAVAAAHAGDTIVVCPGTYHEDVTVSTPVIIEGFGATVAPTVGDASPLTPLLGDNNGFTVLSPWVTITGFTVEGATGDGIFVAGDYARIENNTVENNGVYYAPGLTGNGINLDGSSHSIVRNNTVSGSGNGGIQLANDPEAIGLGTLCGVFGLLCSGSSGTASYDYIFDNNVNNNPYACGILLVDHAGTDGSVANLAGGIHDNVIQGNQVLNNAMHGYGAGILLATEAPGGAVYNNVIRSNEVAGNGLAGLTLHAHLGGVNQDLNGNAIIYNDFGTNNLKFEEPSDLQTTGIFVGSKDHLNITVIGNTIHDNFYGVFTASPNGVTVNGLTYNTYVNDTAASSSSNTYIG